ncbi:MAG: alcohol dehydrogenase [Bacteroidetes bacterium]|nr:MAG: alcohol dehydrogenase [Bacteroidota bacterium]
MVELLSSPINYDTMKAAIHLEYGPPEVVNIREVDKPVPAENELLIKVVATTVNRTDCGFRSAEYFVSRFFSGLLRPKQTILGNEFAGIVVAVGNQVKEFSRGDKVFGYNDVTFGAHAEYLKIPSKGAIALMPENLSFREAAALTEGAHYALCDIRAAKVKKGQEVLVNGATGAIGSAAVQLLKHEGAIVTAVCGTDNVELVKSLGADKVIDFLKSDFTKTDDRFDFVFDAVGKSSYGACKNILKKHGIYISTELGKNAENIYLALITPLVSKKRLLFPLPYVSRDDVYFLKELAEKRVFKPVIDREYSLNQIVDAYKYVETGQKIGNVLIIVDEQE